MSLKLVLMISFTSRRDYFRGYIAVIGLAVHMIYRVLEQRAYGPFSETIKKCHIQMIG